LLSELPLALLGNHSQGRNTVDLGADRALKFEFHLGVGAEIYGLLTHFVFDLEEVCATEGLKQLNHFEVTVTDCYVERCVAQIVGDLVVGVELGDNLEQRCAASLNDQVD